MLHYLRQPCAPPHAMAGLVGRTKALTNSPSNCLQGCRQQRSDQGRKLALFKAINPRRFNLDFIEAGLGELFVFAETRRRYDPLRASKTCRKWIFCPSVVVLFNTLDRGCRIVVFEINHIFRQAFNRAVSKTDARPHHSPSIQNRKTRSDCSFHASDLIQGSRFFQLAAILPLYLQGDQTSPPRIFLAWWSGYSASCHETC